MTYLRDVIERVSRQFLKNGSFFLQPGESINDAVIRERVPNEFGVYLIYDRNRTSRPIDIGKAGTMRTDGTWKNQGLRGRLTAIQKHKRRVEYFRELMCDTCTGGLEFRWFVTHDGEKGRLPALVEMELLQAHVDEFRRLPDNNECA